MVEEADVRPSNQLPVKPKPERESGSACDRGWVILRGRPDGTADRVAPVAARRGDATIELLVRPRPAKIVKENL
jgi:hypothetical protein